MHFTLWCKSSTAGVAFNPILLLDIQQWTAPDQNADGIRRRSSGLEVQPHHPPHVAFGEPNRYASIKTSFLCASRQMIMPCRQYYLCNFVGQRHLCAKTLL